MTHASKQSVVNAAVEVLERYFGKNTARIYSKYYENQDERQILKSVKQLLDELLGPEKAKDVLNQIHLLSHSQ